MLFVVGVLLLFILVCRLEGLDEIHCEEGDGVGVDGSVGASWSVHVCSHCGFI